MIWLRKVWLFTCIALLSSCTVQYMYKNIDWFVLSYLDDYVELTDKQEGMLRIGLAKIRIWHRTEQLPLYLQHIKELKQLPLNEVSAEDIASHAARLRQYWKNLVVYAEPEVSKLVLSFQPEQMKSILTTVQQQNSERREEYLALSEKEQQEEVEQGLVELTERWLGSVSKPQRQVITQLSKQSQPTTLLWLDYGQGFLTRLQRVYLRRSEQSYFHQALRQILTQGESYYPEELVARLEFNRQQRYSAIASILGLASPQQIRYFHQELDNWYEIVESLSAPDE